MSAAPAAPARANATGAAPTRFEFLAPEQLDDLGRAVLTLAREVWVLRDRQRILEHVLAERGVDVADAIDRYQPGPELQKRLDAERAAFVKELLGALAPGTPL